MINRYLSQDWLFTEPGMEITKVAGKWGECQTECV